MTPTAERHMVVTEENGVTIASITKKQIIDEAEIQEMGQELHGLVDRGCGRLMIEFEAVDFMSSTFLGMLIALEKKIKVSGARLVLCCLDPKVYSDLFVVTSLHKLFKFADTREQGLASLH